MTNVDYPRNSATVSVSGEHSLSAKTTPAPLPTVPPSLRARGQLVCRPQSLSGETAAETFQPGFKHLSLSLSDSSQTFGHPQSPRRPPREHVDVHTCTKTWTCDKTWSAPKRRGRWKAVRVQEQFNRL